MSQIPKATRWAPGIASVAAALAAAPAGLGCSEGPTDARVGDVPDGATARGTGASAQSTAIAEAGPWTPACPSGTSESGNACVLDGDLVLEAPLELGAPTTLNCHGHRILPTSAGTGTTPGSYVASVPATAIVVTSAERVDVRNCVIGRDDQRFDFGIIAIDCKGPTCGGHRIHDNEIHARDTALTLMRTDDARVSSNLMTWTHGFGIWVARDSDRNRLDDNVLVSAGAPPAPGRLLPDGPFRTPVDDAIFLGVLHPTPVLNLVVGGRLHQFPNSEDGTYASQDDNVVEANDVSLPGSSVGKSHAGVLVAINAQRTRLVDNTISEAGVGVRLAGMMANQQVQRASRCVDGQGAVTSRYCATDADCFIAGLDAAPVGTCPPLQTDVRDFRGRDTRVEGNTLLGPFTSTNASFRAGILGGNGSVDVVIANNHVIGTGTEAGIALAGYPLESATVTGNVVENAAFGLMLAQEPTLAIPFGARVFLNDVTGSTTRAIGVQGAYTLPTELSFEGTGNFWGHTSPPCFRPADTPLPALIQDGHPSCAPVASTAAP